MKVTTILLLVARSFVASAQLGVNESAKLTKGEFQQLLKRKSDFVPTDLRNDTVIVVRYTAERLLQMEIAAQKKSIAQNGIDTTGIEKDSLFHQKGWRPNMKWFAKRARKLPEADKKSLSKKGVHAVIVDEDNLKARAVQCKHWLKTSYVSNRANLTGGWVDTLAIYFYDSAAERNYEVLLVINHKIFDLID